MGQELFCPEEGAFLRFPCWCSCLADTVQGVFKENRPLPYPARSQLTPSRLLSRSSKPVALAERDLQPPEWKQGNRKGLHSLLGGDGGGADLASLLLARSLGAFMGHFQFKLHPQHPTTATPRSGASAPGWLSALISVPFRRKWGAVCW